jgi:L-iditol 2-dehydrogenase
VAPDAVFVTAPGGEPLRWALDHVAPGGIVNAFAGTPGGADVDANLVHYRHLKLVGSTGSRRSDHQAARDLVVDGAIDPTRIPHRVVPLDAAPAALTEPAPPDVLKTFVVIDSG